VKTTEQKAFKQRHDALLDVLAEIQKTMGLATNPEPCQQPTKEVLNNQQPKTNKEIIA
jgi:hypothetical protein